MGWTGAIWEKFPGFPELLTPSTPSRSTARATSSPTTTSRTGTTRSTSRPTAIPTARPNPIADRLPVSIDFYGNDIFNMGDNCIESDGGAHNIRVFRNRCFNVGVAGAVSAQPMFGGPVYFYPEPRLQRAGERVAEVRRDAGRRARLPEHVHRRGRWRAARRRTCTSATT